VTAADLAKGVEAKLRRQQRGGYLTAQGIVAQRLRCLGDALSLLAARTIDELRAEIDSLWERGNGHEWHEIPDDEHGTLRRVN